MILRSLKISIMNVTTSTVLDILARLRSYFHGGITIRNYNNEEPFRSELYSTEQMNRHGEIVARSHKLLNRKSPDQLLKRLDDNEETLLEVRKLLIESIHHEKTVTPAAEWLLDNFYLIEEQVVIARKHLPRGYSEGLPYLANSISAGMPRVYDIVLEIISHSDGRVNAKSLSSFISAYQKNTTLTLGELWAIPIMLRLAVIENLRRVSRKIALHMIDNNLADVWSDAMTKTVNEEPGNLILTIADLARSKPVLSGPFVAAFIRKLQGTGPSLALPLSWMEQQLSGMGITSIDLVREENQKQAADQVSVRNCIGTLRFLNATDWREFVETLSLVEQVLRQDITGTYPLMDFATRDRYRHVVEAISKASPLSETEVAQKVLDLALKHKDLNTESKREDQLGYYLIDKGLRKTEIACGMLSTLKQKLSRFTRRKPVFLYLLSIAFVTLLSATGMFYVAWGYGINSWLLLTFVGLLSVSGSAHLAVSMVNWLSTIWVKPKLLPRMDFSKGIPAECRTLVIVPTMLSGKAYIEQLVEALEIRYLANKDDNLHFGLLTDYLDSDAAIMPGDDDLLELVSARIEELNQKYKQTEQDIFFLFHRPRRWNTRERKWMGYERKRGKLSALNAFIQGRSSDEFSLVVG
jgi:cyclic beta-1,2-glucan synthetase